VWDGGVVIDFGVDSGFVGLGYGGDAERCVAVHENGCEVCAVAAEVEHGASAVLYRVGEPGEPLGAYADLFGAVVAVVHDDFADFAQLAFVCLAKCFRIAGVPGGLVVYKDLDVVLDGRVADGQRVGHGGGEGLFDHGAYAMACGQLDDLAVVEDGCVDQHCLRVNGVEHSLGVGVEEGMVKMEALFIFGGEGGVGLGDADQLDVGVLWERAEEAAHVAVDQSDDGDRDGRRSGLRPGRVS